MPVKLQLSYYKTSRSPLHFIKLNLYFTEYSLSVVKYRLYFMKYQLGQGKRIKLFIF